VLDPPGTLCISGAADETFSDPKGQELWQNTKAKPKKYYETMNENLPHQNRAKSAKMMVISG